MDKIHSKLDAIQSDITDMKITLAVQAQQLGEHMKRSDLLEQRVEQVDSDVQPIKEHIIFLKGLAKLVGLSTAILAIVKLLEKLSW